MNFNSMGGPTRMTPHMSMQIGQDPSSTSGEMMIVKKPNTLPLWGNTTTMNLNPLIHTNIENSPYFSGRLSELKTYHELVDEIYYKVKHLEPWEKGSRNAGGRRQTGMCGGVRGVGVGGIISSAFCILYRLYAVRLTRKQLYGLLNHQDSPYIRGIGFLYVRFSQPPGDFWEWFEPYIDDPEEVDARAGGGQIMTIGEIVRHLITRQDWFSTLFPRIPVPIQIQIDKKLASLKHATSVDPTPRSNNIFTGNPSSTETDEREEYSNNSRSSSHGSRSRGESPVARSRSGGDVGRSGGGGGSSSSGRRDRSRSPLNDKKHRKRSRSRSPKRRRDIDRRSKSPSSRSNNKDRDRDYSYSSSSRHRHDRR